MRIKAFRKTSVSVFGNSGGKLVQTSAEDKIIYTLPSAAELARSECLSVVFIYKLATLVVRNPREASYASGCASCLRLFAD